MSLINEALRKARLEAARQDSAQRGIRYPAAGELRPASRLGPVVAAVVLVVLVGALLFWLGQRSTGDAVASQTAAVASPPADGVASPPADGVASPPADGVASPPAGGVAERSTNAPAAEPSQPAASQQTSEPAPTAAAAPSPAPETDPRLVPQGTPPAAFAGDRAERPTAPPARAATSPPPDPRPAPGEPRAIGGASGPSDRVTAEPPPARPEPSSDPEPPAPATQARQPRVDPAPAAAPARMEPDSEPPASEPAPTEAPDQTFVREATIPGAGNFRLGGIAWSERQPYALINGQVVGPGDRIQGLLVSSVGKAEVALTETGGTTYILRIR